MLPKRQDYYTLLFMIRDKKGKIKSELLPGGGLVGTQQLFGRFYIWKWIFRLAWRYERTIFYLLRKKGLKATINFLYVKIFVPTGEGSGGAAFFLIGWLIRRFPQLAPSPKYIEMEMTTICNKRCIICEHTYWKPKTQEIRHLTYKEFKKYVDQFPGLKWVNLTGEGSAFLNPEYVKMLKYLKSKDIPVFLVDHLADIDKKVLETLVEIGIDGIYVSMDGATKKTYEKIKVGCNFDKAVENIKYLIRLIHGIGDGGYIKSHINQKIFYFLHVFVASYNHSGRAIWQTGIGHERNREIGNALVAVIHYVNNFKIPFFLHYFYTFRAVYYFRHIKYYLCFFVREATTDTFQDTRHAGRDYETGFILFRIIAFLRKIDI